MLIYTWNEHPNMQADKLICKVSFACPAFNQCTKHLCIQEQDPTRAQEWSNERKMHDIYHQVQKRHSMDKKT